MTDAVKLVISVDVEEEGLFSGNYDRTPPGVTNVSELSRLEFIPREFGLPLTLLVAYQVTQDRAAQEILTDWREHHGAEIGAHLHPWNTPPLWDLPDPEPVRSRKMPAALLGAKLRSLTSALEWTVGVTPRSFRMGRFDWCPELLDWLPRCGYWVDSSMVPLTQKVGGPNHFLVPRDPFWLPEADSRFPPLLEVPLTMAPVWTGAASLVYRFSRLFPGRLGESCRSWFPYLAAAGLQPAWYPLASMCLGAYLHRRQGGRVFTLFFHSSELQPGATPQFRTAAQVDGLVHKIRRFLAWLTRTYPVSGTTLSQLAADWPRGGP